MRLDDDHKRRFIPNWTFVVVLCVILAIGAGGWLTFNYINQSTSAPDQYNSVMSQADYLDQELNYTDEASTLKNYLATNPPKQDRYKPLVLLGNLAVDDHNNAKAVQYYQQAVADDGGHLTEFDAETIGQTEAAEGNNTLALQYFKNALKIAQANPAESGDIDDLNATIKNLEGQP